MPLEATVMVIDNSEYMRKGDYPPTRFDAQSDAVNMIFQTKTTSNPESTVGVVTSAGKCPEVLVTPTQDLDRILQGVHTASRKLGGEIDIPTTINIAQLALEHPENENVRQRIVVFVGSPLEGSAADENKMIELAEKLKKDNVAVDVVTFGDGVEEPDAEGKTLWKSFVDNANSSGNSHLVSIAPGTLLLSDAIISSPILAADRGALLPEDLQDGGGAEASGGAGGARHVDPSLDPELATALQPSRQSAQPRDAHNPAMTTPMVDSTGVPLGLGIFGHAQRFSIGSMSIVVTLPSDHIHLVCIGLGLGAFVAGIVLGWNFFAGTTTGPMSERYICIVLGRVPL